MKQNEQSISIDELDLKCADSKRRLPCRMSPTTMANPNPKSRLARIEPVIEAFATVEYPLTNATVPMISSGKLLNDALSRPPTVWPNLPASFSVATPRTPTSKKIERIEITKTTIDGPWNTSIPTASITPKIGQSCFMIQSWNLRAIRQPSFLSGDCVCGTSLDKARQCRHRSIMSTL
jgi:hypothetical protein